MIDLFCYACEHRFLLFVPALFFFAIPIIQALSAAAQDGAAARKREARARAEAQRKREAEEARRKTEAERAARCAAEEAKPKRGPGRPRKNPPPDPNAPKRPRGRPRKNPAPSRHRDDPAQPKKSKKLAAPDAHKYDPAGACPAWVSPDGRFSHAAVAALSSPDDFINTLSA